MTKVINDLKEKERVAQQEIEKFIAQSEAIFNKIKEQICTQK